MSVDGFYNLCFVYKTLQSALNSLNANAVIIFWHDEDNYH